MNTDKHEWSFETLVGSIRQVHEELAAQAGRAVNISLTLRNWFIGYYIAEYELRGADRAKYGTRLFRKLSAKLKAMGVSRSDERELRRYRKFYQVYPQIRESVTPELEKMIPGDLGFTGSQIQAPKGKSVSLPGKEILSKLSFSHIAELLKDRR